ncbi:hypothetical protein PIB30_094197 [Stylosanthes scabra]|uniref:Uncharacterized protein n=1 Tax=Stylosanthes scabra TaxID=79078 RepID=A0ABU6SVU4_9FABA|nr:hypothetical protein [Stylosanthes scabra]
MHFLEDDISRPNILNVLWGFPLLGRSINDLGVLLAPLAPESSLLPRSYGRQPSKVPTALADSRARIDSAMGRVDFLEPFAEIICLWRFKN